MLAGRAAAKLVELAAAEQDWTPHSQGCIQDLARMAGRVAGADNDASACQALLALTALHDVHLAGGCCSQLRHVTGCSVLLGWGSLLRLALGQASDASAWPFTLAAHLAGGPADGRAKGLRLRHG